MPCDDINPVRKKSTEGLKHWYFLHLPHNQWYTKSYYASISKTPDTTLELPLYESGLDQLCEHNNLIGMHTKFGEYSEENQQNIRNSYRSKSHEMLQCVVG
jgi:hypothetical protein